MLTRIFFIAIQKKTFRNERNLIESFELPRILKFLITSSKHTLSALVSILLLTNHNVLKCTFENHVNHV